MFNNQRNGSFSYAGIPYEDINWYDIAGQPFGIASYFNAIVFGDANNIVDIKGAFAVGRDFVSPRGLTLAYGNDVNLVGTGYSPDFVRFLVGRNVAMQGPLVVIGHVVAGSNFRAAGGSTYMIGKDGTTDQVQELKTLYQAQGGSQYWTPSDRGSHYAISSYDVPRYIPAGRIGADVARFFNDARESIGYYHECISDLSANGTVVDNYHEKILRGNDPVQNVFIIDARPNGILNKEIRFEIPEGSIAIVKFRTGNNAHLQYGLWGAEYLANRTLYVFEDATNIYMEVPAAIWGSILAPNAMFHGHQTGGHVSGNVALGSFAVNARSGFEFHLYPFVGGVVCEEVSPLPPEIPAPRPTPPPPRIPVPRPTPAPTPPPEVQPIVECPPCPQPEPCPTPQPCPPCPMPEPCPPCPMPEPCPPCPMPEPCPPCPPCPQPEPCPPCPQAETRIEYRPYPVRVPVPYQSMRTKVIYRKILVKEKAKDCLIIPGKIMGCIWGCECCCDHDYTVKLYKVCDEKKIQLYCEKVGPCGCFEFEVPYDDCYVLEICPDKSYKRNIDCKPMLTLKNVGVSSLRVLN
jgi:choice-of-anchor A domain-containing protein